MIVSRLCLPVMLAAVALTSSAKAEDDVGARAEALFQEGVRAGQQGDHERARAAFEASFALQPRGSALRNMAMAEAQEGKAIDAVKHLKQALSYADAGHKEQVQGDIDRLYETSVGRIAVDTDAGAALTVDGVPTPGRVSNLEPLDVQPGQHVLVASMGSRSARADVVARAGTVVHSDLRLPPLASAAAPNDSISEPMHPEPGRDAPGLPSEPVAGPTSWWTAQRGWAAGLLGVAVVGVSVGAYFDVASNSAANDAQAVRATLMPNACGSGSASPAACQTLQDDVQRTHQDATVFQVAYAVGAVAAAGAIVVWLLPSASTRVAGTALWRPWVGAGSAGVEGRF